MSFLIRPADRASDCYERSPELYCASGNHFWRWLVSRETGKTYFLFEIVDQNRAKSLFKNLANIDGSLKIVCPAHYNFGFQDLGNELSLDFETTNIYGIHARPSAEIASFCLKYDDGYVKIHSEGEVKDAKDIMHLMMLELVCGTKFNIRFQLGLDATGRRVEPDLNLLEKICLGIYHAATTELH